jgi:ABC-2 type transport system permease protein
MNAFRIGRHALLLGYVDFRTQWSWKAWLGGWLIRVLSQAVFFTLIGQLVGSPERMQYLLIGNSVVVGVDAARLALQATTWDRYEGTYALLVASPAGLIPPFVGRTVVWLLDGIATSLIALFVVGTLFAIPGLWTAAPSVAALVALVCASMYCLAIFEGAVISRLPAIRNMASQLTGLTIMAVCGVNVPVAFWPPWVQAVANVLPVTHGLHAVRLTLAGAPVSAVLAEAGLELLVGLAWLGLAILTFDRLAEAGRADGSIELASM